MLEMSGGTMEGTVAATPAPSSGDGFPPFDAARERPASLAACHTAADRLDYLCGKVQGNYVRQRGPDGTVTLRLKTAAGDVLAATHSTTSAAVAQLLARAGVTE